MALGIAKALLCKNRFDSFQAAEADGSGDSMMTCKWRADSFAVLEPSEPNEQRHPGNLDRRQRIAQESAVLEALARQRGPVHPTGSFEACAPRSRLDMPEEMGRLQAMEMASREAAIRENLQQEMNSACSVTMPLPTASFQMSFSAPNMSPARARGRGQPGQRQGHRSRSSLPAQGHHQPLVATAVARTDSFRQTVDAVKIAATEQFLQAESFRQAALSPRPRRNSFGTTTSFGLLQSFVAEPQSPMRSSSFSFNQQIPSWMPAAVPQAGPSSPCSSRASSFSMGAVVMSRQNSFNTLPPATTAFGSQPRCHARSGSYVPVVAIPDMSAMQRAMTVVEEQAQLAARLNTAAEMIDNIVMDNSVLNDAKRITEAAHAQQARRQQQQRRASPSPPPTFTNRQAQPQSTSRARSSSLFWKPPPEAVQICARCPSIDSRESFTIQGRTNASRFGAPPPSSSFSRGMHVTV